MLLKAKNPFPNCSELSKLTLSWRSCLSESDEIRHRLALTLGPTSKASTRKSFKNHEPKISCAENAIFTNYCIQSRRLQIGMKFDSGLMWVALKRLRDFYNQIFPSAKNGSTSVKTSTARTIRFRLISPLTSFASSDLSRKVLVFSKPKP